MYDLTSQRVLAGAAGAGGENTYIEDVFSTWLYTGNGSTQTITNGIDLSGKGGLVWIKGRPSTYAHSLTDTARGTNKQLFSNLTNAEQTDVNQITSFTSTGFTLGDNSTGSGGVNFGTGGYASWTFRKAKGFFDVVTYTGTGSARTVAHNLGSVPGTIIVKCTSTTGNWIVYHRSLGATKNLVLDLTNAENTSSLNWNDTAPTASVFTVGSGSLVNTNGATYVAYLFAHDEQVFGDGGNQSVVKCASVTMPSSGTWQDVSLGWEPQWILVKNSNAGFPTDWHIFDNMRGVVTGGGDADLLPNSSNSESSSDFIEFTSTGFRLQVGQFGTNQTVVYIAIRRGPMRTPTDATKVFYTSTTGVGSNVTAGFAVDTYVVQGRSGGAGMGPFWATRLLGKTNQLISSSTAAEASNGTTPFDSNTIITQNLVGTPANWVFRRAPGFFDVVAYTGTGSARTVSHNLGVVPELMIVKRRNAVVSWLVYSSTIGATKYLSLNTTAAEDTFTSAWNNTSPTASAFTVGDAAGSNVTAGTYIAYLFASCPGVSKCFTFTGNGTSQTINCGFTAGARFVLVKRTDSTGNWLVADTARGIVSGNDPLLYLNSTAAEITTLDWIDPDSSGFIVNQEATANANVNGATYIGLAIA